MLLSQERGEFLGRGDIRLKAAQPSQLLPEIRIAEDALADTPDHRAVPPHDCFQCAEVPVAHKAIEKLAVAEPGAERAEPDPVWIHVEKMKPGVTLELLHIEYLESHPNGLRYTAFCERYREWLARRKLTMRQSHKAGERAFVDYNDVMSLLERMIVSIVETIKERNADDLKLLELQLPAVELPFPKYTYSDLVDKLQEAGERIQWGDDISPQIMKSIQHDRRLNGFYFIIDWPTSTKPFYIKPSTVDSRVSESFDLMYGALGV